MLEARNKDGKDPNRWVVVILFSIFSFINAFQWVTFSSIENSARVFFSLTTMELNLLSMIFMIVFVFFALIACTVFERWGVRTGILVGSGLNALGSILKFAPGLIYPSFTSMMIPQTINSVAQLFVLSVPPLLSAEYFDEDDRVFANAIGTTANLLGSAAGLLLPPFITPDPSKSEFEILFGLQLAISCCIFFLAIFFVKHPQRKSQAMENNAAVEFAGNTAEDWRTPFVEVGVTLKKIFTNRDFLCVLGGFGFTTGSIWSIASILAQIYEPFGLSQVHAGVSCAGNVVAGTIAAYFVGAWVDRHPLYKIFLIICLSSSLVVMSAFCIILAHPPENQATMAGVSIFLLIFAGIFQITAVPLSFELAMEVTYPVSESVPGAVMMALSNLISLILVVVVSVVVGDGFPTRDNALYSIIIIVSASSLGLFSILGVRENLLRRDASKEKHWSQVSPLQADFESDLKKNNPYA